uniref:DNA (cytosine-5-)-methyltransferase n=2 Tax=Ditylum brightwellii TaxID=49249 RepID=A0A7S4SA65_9STRA
MNDETDESNNNNKDDKKDVEAVLLVPPPYTKSCYAILMKHDCVGRTWHPEGRYGSRTHKVDSSHYQENDDEDYKKEEGEEKKKYSYKVGIPLLQSKVSLIQQILDKKKKQQQQPKCEITNESSLEEFLRTTPKVQLIYKEPIISNRIPKVEVLDGTVRSELIPPTFDVLMKKVLERQQKRGDGSVVAGRKRKHSSSTLSPSLPSFTFCELFAGIGGFGIALERLGGECIFASEIYQPSINLYQQNLDTTHLQPNQTIAGDIWTIDAHDIPSHDILVAGFPCQPFSTLGLQPGFKDDKVISGRGFGTTATATTTNEVKRRRKDANNNSSSNVTEHDTTNDSTQNNNNTNNSGRGQLFTQIVRVLKHVQPKAFLLENVPGLLTTPAFSSSSSSSTTTTSSTPTTAWQEIEKALQNVGYHVYMEAISSRGLTSQARKRLYIVGLLQDKTRNKTSKPSFQFPFMPDLKLRAMDVLHTQNELIDASLSSFISMGIPESLLSILQQQQQQDTKQPASYFQISDAQLHQLLHKSKSWKPAKLAWNDKTCDTIDSHYGISIGKGHSQLVPSPAPYHPRKFTPRECARIMGFPNTYQLGDFDKTRFFVSNNTNDNNDEDNNRRDNTVDSRFNGFIKEQYYMLGNAVCPPVIAVLAGAILEHILSSSCNDNVDEKGQDKKENWVKKGLETGIQLSLDAISPVHLDAVCQRLHSSYCQ